ncbi:MAG TPA: hypothetical protein VFT91_10445 [Dehalococcoidia bacterium]|nr:hypothetical protein [Dehalococcoidia bacterium]
MWSSNRRLAAGKPPALAALVVSSLALLAAACQTGSGNGTPSGIVVSITTPTPQPSPQIIITPTPSPTPTPQPLQVCLPNPDPAPPGLLQVLEPKPEQKVAIPFHIRGWGSTIGFQNAGVAIAVVNDKQEVVQVLSVPPQPRDFRVLPPGMENTDYTRPFGADIVVTDIAGPTAFCIWVYLETADGTPKSVVQVPVLVAP